MPNRCVYPGCCWTIESAEKLTLFSFPSLLNDSVRRHIWLNNIGLTEAEINSACGICQVHFSEDFIIRRPCTSYRLHKNAVPLLCHRNQAPSSVDEGLRISHSQRKVPSGESMLSSSTTVSSILDRAGITTTPMQAASSNQSITPGGDAGREPRSFVPPHTNFACCVPGCESKQVRSNPIAFHRFPSDVKRKRQWIEFCGLSPDRWYPSADTRICSAHFLVGGPTQYYPIPTLLAPSSTNDSSTNDDREIDEDNERESEVPGQQRYYYPQPGITVITSNSNDTAASLGLVDMESRRLSFTKPTPRPGPLSSKRKISPGSGLVRGEVDDVKAQPIPSTSVQRRPTKAPSSSTGFLRDTRPSTSSTSTKPATRSNKRFKLSYSNRLIVAALKQDSLTRHTTNDDSEESSTNHSTSSKKPIAIRPSTSSASTKPAVRSNNWFKKLSYSSLVLEAALKQDSLTRHTTNDDSEESPTNHPTSSKKPVVIRFSQEPRNSVAQRLGLYRSPDEEHVEHPYFSANPIPVVRINVTNSINTAEEQPSQSLNDGLNGNREPIATQDDACASAWLQICKEDPDDVRVKDEPQDDPPNDGRMELINVKTEPSA